ncbi:MFS transporter [Streptococcus gallinaceus]|uniref:MFS family permease n=1 Tax=Streptococcus gallinaceus TaxID=165758 RepID=A0ABV2JN48_9STRE
MKRIIEKISILSLSLMLVSTFAVSPALPQMMKEFACQGISAAQVEFLMTIPSLTIMLTLLANGFIVKFFSERAIVVTGLLAMAIGGSMPIVFASYPLMVVARIILGLGIGLINARAINIIGYYYQGKERIQMLGLRGSTEVLGSAGLTMIVGWLTGYGWQAAFLIYLLALVILGLFLAFVPSHHEEQATDTVEAPKVTKPLWKMGLALAFLAFFVINVNTFITIRIPIIVDQAGLGTAVQASWVLSLMQLMGIVSGTVFGQLMGRFKGWLLSLSYLIFGLAVLVVAYSANLFVLAIGAMCSGFFYSLVLAIVFSRVTEQTPPPLLNTLMTVVLLGCNIGGASASVLPNFLEKLNPSKTGAFGIYAITCLVIGAYLLFRQWKKLK